MDDTKCRMRLSDLAGVLDKTESRLQRSWAGQHSSFKHCDEWCKLWMLLIGAWYSLAWAAHSLEDRLPLKDALPGAHKFARNLLKATSSGLAAVDINPWHTGYFLISAEHRLANTIDRLTTLFFFPQKAKNGLYDRCELLRQQCPHCSSPPDTYLPTAAAVLRNFAAHPCVTTHTTKDLWLSGSAVARVYDRVNTIKHKRPDADAVADLPTGARWSDAADGTGDLALLMQDMLTHWASDQPRGAA